MKRFDCNILRISSMDTISVNISWYNVNYINASYMNIFDPLQIQFDDEMLTFNRMKNDNAEDVEISNKWNDDRFSYIDSGMNFL